MILVVIVVAAAAVAAHSSSSPPPYSTDSSVPRCARQKRKTFYSATADCLQFVRELCNERNAREFPKINKFPVGEVITYLEEEEEEETEKEIYQSVHHKKGIRIELPRN